MEKVITHGDQLSSKADNDVRIYFENVDGLNIEPTKPVTQNIKLNYLNFLMAKMEVDILEVQKAVLTGILFHIHINLKKVKT